MKKLRVILGFLALLLMTVATASQAQQTPAPTSLPAATAATPALTPAPLAIAPIAPIANTLGQTLQTLVGVSSSQPGAANAADSEDNLGQISDNFASDIFDTLQRIIDRVKADSAALTNNTAALQNFADWFAHQSSDAHRQILWSAIGNDFLIAVIAPMLTGIAAALFLLPVRLRLKRHSPQALPQRAGLLLSLLVIRIVPALLFLSLGLLLLDQNEAHKLPRFVISSVLYAASLAFVFSQILRGFFAPGLPHLRLTPFSAPQAVALHRWLNIFSQIIIFSYFLIDIATALRVPADSVILFQNVVALILTALAIIVILKTRLRVAAVIHGKMDDETPSFGGVLRGWLARHWHRLAIAYLLISLAISWLNITDGFAFTLRGTILSVAILASARMLYLALDLWVAPKSNNAALIHRQLLSFILRPVLFLAVVIAIAVTWGFRLSALIATPAGQRAFAAVISIGLTLFVLTVLYELLNAAIERHLNRRDKATKLPVASARAQTLLPMVRNSIFIVFSVIVVLVCLSSVGFNIAPLLAGAGVVGVAIGFGSQTLVKDFLTGLFIVIENNIAVGDVVKIDTFSGVVEALSIRTVRLRDTDGSLHILPFGEVTKLTNMTKGFAYAVIELGVSYDSDLEHVMNVMRDVGARIQEDAIFKRVILEPLEVMGVDKLGDSAITIIARMRTRPGKQWDVRRLLLLRMKQRFDQEGIELPFPTVTNLTKIVGQNSNPDK